MRTVAGDPSDIQVLYEVAGERRLPEQKLSWLPGHDGARPVHIGNQAFQQFQLDLYGEVMEGMHLAREKGFEPEPTAWHLQYQLIDRLESIWGHPDEGIWETRGKRAQFIYFQGDGMGGIGSSDQGYDPERQCRMGNFPQGLSHLALVNAAHAFIDADSMRGEQEDADSQLPI